MNLLEELNKIENVKDKIKCVEKKINSEVING